MLPELILLVSLYVLARSIEINTRNRPKPGEPFYRHLGIRVVSTLAMVWALLLTLAYGFQAFNAVGNPAAQPNLYDWKTTEPKGQ